MHMSARVFLPRLNTLYMRIVVGSLLIFGSLAASSSANAGQAQEQPPSPLPQQTPPPQQEAQPRQNPQDSGLPTSHSGPKPRKIWTNDDLAGLRTPEDIYLAEKESQQEAKSKAATAEMDLAKQGKQPGLKIELPSTPEETQRLIRTREGQIADWQERMKQLVQGLPDASEEVKTSSEKQIQALTNDMQKAQLELEVLRDYLSHLGTGAAKVDEASPAKPAPAVPPNSQ